MQWGQIKAQNPYFGPRMISGGYQRDGGEGSRRQDGKMKERKTGSNSPSVINFWLQVPHLLSPKPCVSSGTRPKAFDPLRSLSHVTRQALGGDLSRAMNTRLGRKITYRKPFTGLQEKNRPIKCSYISRKIINVSGATVLPRCWPPASGMYDFTVGRRWAHSAAI